MSSERTSRRETRVVEVSKSKALHDAPSDCEYFETPRRQTHPNSRHRKATTYPPVPLHLNHHVLIIECLLKVNYTKLIRHMGDVSSVVHLVSDLASLLPLPNSSGPRLSAALANISDQVSSQPICPILYSTPHLSGFGH